MTNNLPPGPWRFCVESVHGGQCMLFRDAGGNAIYVHESPIRELLIRAEREADPTRLTIEDVERMLGRKRHSKMAIVDGGRFGFCFGMGLHCSICADCGVVGCLKTHGEFRTFCRLFGIEVKE